MRNFIISTLRVLLLYYGYQIKDGGVDGTCSTRKGDKKRSENFQNEWDLLGHLRTDGKIILKWFLRK